MSTFVNKYGWPIVRKVDPNEAWHHYSQYYLVDESVPNTKYMCFEADDQRVIWKETVSSSTTKLEFAFGSWDDRTSLTYVPINGQYQVD